MGAASIFLTEVVAADTRAPTRDVGTVVVVWQMLHVTQLCTGASRGRDKLQT